MPDADETTSTAAAVVRLGRLALDLGTTPRITLHPDGQTYESVATHTVMLGLTACALAERWNLNLRTGLIAQYALVHDLVEAICGDTPTLVQLGPDQKEAKKQREAAALDQIRQQLDGQLPSVAWLIASYEDLATPEARFVKLLDKVMPKITHMLNAAEVIHRQGMTHTQLKTRYEAQGRELDSLIAEFPEVEQLRQNLVAEVLKCVPDPEAMRPARVGDVYTEKDRVLPANVLEFRDDLGDRWRPPVGDEKYAGDEHEVDRDIEYDWVTVAGGGWACTYWLHWPVTVTKVGRLEDAAASEGVPA